MANWHWSDMPPLDHVPTYPQTYTPPPPRARRLAVASAMLAVALVALAAGVAIGVAL
jgi:hypothetical protein